MRNYLAPARAHRQAYTMQDLNIQHLRGQVHFRRANGPDIGQFPVTSDAVAAETAKDPILSRVLTHCRLGWTRRGSHPDIVTYFGFRDSLTIVIPPSLQAVVLKLVHQGHPGIVRSKTLARSKAFWPSLNSDIETLVRSCLACAAINLPKLKEFLPWPGAKAPFERIYDFFQFKSLTFFLLVDAYSKWLHVSFMQRTTASHVNKDLLSIFSVFGLPATVMSDNGPPFDSNEYAQFCTSFNITILHSLPVYHLASNGIAKRNVAIAKRALGKLLSSNNSSVTCCPS
ncbi:hypothetical protein FOCC_FOCC012633 [Frankliniella occidentalis]|nr:hypothetical protein FOCC_FOCC012633 [Frankliniella occidentalis]